MVIHWFRQDLRLDDNPALLAAARAGEVLPIYILDDETAGEWRQGSASRVWLHHSLLALNQALAGKLRCFRGPAGQVFQTLAALPLKGVFWNRCYEPWRRTRDSQLKTALRSCGLEVQSFNGSLLWEPWQTVKSDKTPYQVFTPFYKRGCLLAEPPAAPLAKPAALRLYETNLGQSPEGLALLPRIRWDLPVSEHWPIGEHGAGKLWSTFLDQGLKDYRAGRDYPARLSVSRLSPYLHFGEISPRRLWHDLSALAPDDQVDCFKRELIWREFCHALLFHYPELPEQNWRRKFDAFPWRDDADALRRWQQGMTGIPMVDAGMRELWQTGYMHNRVRMIVASFLVKNLQIDWRQGQRWFWDCLFDADLANNSGGWQWVAGSGADAAPYFRVFNPVVQAEKFDAGGDYIRRFVPELAKLPDANLAAPWQAPMSVLRSADVTLGSTYPEPMVDLKHSRQAALNAYKTLDQDF